MNILALSGWGQPYHALEHIAPEADHVDYTASEIMSEHDAIIGWSLGGQLAVRAIAAGRAKPKKLVLIAAPFQFVATPEKKLGMPRDQFDKFRDNYAKNPARTLTKAWELIAKNDSKAEHIRTRSGAYDITQEQQRPWLEWLDNLNAFSCDVLDFSDFPPTLLIHGAGDVVVSAEQSHAFAKAIPQAKQFILPESGHAPHWHDEALVRRAIEEFLHV